MANNSNSLRKDVRKKEVTKDLDEFSLAELQRLLAKQTEILSSKVAQNLPDKGAKLKKQVEDIKDRISKLEKVFEEQISSTKSPINSPPTQANPISNESTTPKEPLEEFYGKEIYDQVIKSMNNTNTDEENEIEFIQRKMQFLSVKENRSNQDTNRNKQNILTKGNRALQKSSKQHSAIPLSLKESLKLTKTIQPEKEDLPTYYPKLENKRDEENGEYEDEQEYDREDEEEENVINDKEENL